MWHEQAGAALAGAARDVLETMCFVAAGEVAAPAPLGEPAPDPPQASFERREADPGAVSIVAQVDFRGYWTGRCMVEMPESCARIIAGNFTGKLDPDSVAAVNMIELLCEFANMICGGTITRLQCPGIVTLAPPHLIWEWPRPGRPEEMHVIERWLDTGDGVIRIGFETHTSVEAAS
jgi:CheY-specific phosphatase CheX